jgi:hypothetical protein
MNPTATPVAALTFLGILIAVLGTFVAGSIALIALGFAAIFAGGIIGLLATRQG